MVGSRGQDDQEIKKAGMGRNAALHNRINVNGVSTVAPNTIILLDLTG